MTRILETNCYAKISMMSESVPAEPSIEFVQVRKPLLVSERSVVETVTKRPDNVKIPWSLGKERTIREDALVPTERLQKCFQQARDFVNRVRKEGGLPPVDSSSMEVILFSESNFEKNYPKDQTTANQSGGGSTRSSGGLHGGVYAPGYGSANG